MIFWILLLVGFIICLITLNVIDNILPEKARTKSMATYGAIVWDYVGWDRIKKNEKIILFLLITLSIALSDGTMTGLVVYMSSNSYGLLGQVMISTGYGIFTAWRKYSDYKVSRVTDYRLKIYFATIFIVSTLGWAIYLSVYGQNVFEVLRIVLS